MIEYAGYGMSLRSQAIGTEVNVDLGKRLPDSLEHLGQARKCRSHNIEEIKPRALDLQADHCIQILRVA